MKVVFLSSSDYANLGFNLSKALKRVGVNSDSYALSNHPFGYEEQSIRLTIQQMMERCKDADCVFIMHSAHKLLDCTWKHNRIFAVHTGTPYRQEPEKMNGIFNSVCERIFTDSCEFMTLGGKLVTYVATSIDKTKYHLHHNTGAIKFAHYPSNPEVKATAKIREMMAQIPVSFDCDTSIVNHEQNLRRMSQCDCYIEMFATEQKGKVYGNAGVTAWEAAAMGKVVITNFLHQEVYINAYGIMPFQVANTELEFDLKVRNIAALGRSDLKDLSEYLRSIIVERHSMEATGKYLLQYLQ
jgi:hypothetical protein